MLSLLGMLQPMQPLTLRITAWTLPESSLRYQGLLSPVWEPTGSLLYLLLSDLLSFCPLTTGAEYESQAPHT
jgi:hypothetical protein